MSLHGRINQHMCELLEHKLHQLDDELKKKIKDVHYQNPQVVKGFLQKIIKDHGHQPAMMNPVARNYMEKMIELIDTETAEMEAKKKENQP